MEEFIHIPIKICFLTNNENIGYGYILLIKLCFILNIFIEANTSIFDKDSPITNRFDIFINYFKSYFIFDLISILSFYISDSELSSLQIIFLIRLFYFTNYLKKIKE